MSIDYSVTAHKDRLYHINYCHLPCSVPIFSFTSTPHTHQTALLQFIRRPKFNSIIVTHHSPSAEQSIIFYQILYLFIILSPPIRIPYILSIIAIPHHQCLFLFISLPPPPTSDHFQFIRRPKFNSILVTHNPPSAEQSKFCYQTLCLLVITPPPIRIPCIRSIIVVSHHHFTSPPSEDPIPIHPHAPSRTLLNLTSRHPHQHVP